jgi:hypothetical protein
MFSCIGIFSTSRQQQFKLAFTILSEYILELAPLDFIPSYLVILKTYTVCFLNLIKPYTYEVITI